MVGAALFGAGLLYLLISTVALANERWGLGGAVIALLSAPALWLAAAPLARLIAFGDVPVVYVLAWLAFWIGPFLAGWLAAEPLYRGTSGRTMPYRRRVRFLWQSNMASGGRSLVDYLDAVSVLWILLLGWQGNGLLGLAVAAIAVVTIGGLFRATVLLITAAALSALVVWPLSLLSALVTFIRDDAVPAPLEAGDNSWQLRYGTPARDSATTGATVAPPEVGPAPTGRPTETLYTVGDEVWDGEAGRRAVVAAADHDRPEGPLYEIRYEDGTTKLQYGYELKPWTRERDPELRRQFQATVELMDAMKRSIDANRGRESGQDEGGNP